MSILLRIGMQKSLARLGSRASANTLVFRLASTHDHDDHHEPERPVQEEYDKHPPDIGDGLGDPHRGEKEPFHWDYWDRSNWYRFPTEPIVRWHTNIPWPTQFADIPAVYRGIEQEAAKWPRYISYCFAVIMWWFITYHCIMEPGHVIGEHYYPNRYNWPDSMLGVPPIEVEGIGK